MNLQLIVQLIGAVNVLLPRVAEMEKLIASLFREATAGMDNAQKIAVLKQAGVSLEERGEDWWQAHGFDPV